MEFAKDNPGIGDEIRDHEEIHGDQLEESLKSQFTMDGYTGTIGEILTSIIHDGKITTKI